MADGAFWSGISAFDTQVRSARTLVEHYKTNLFNAATRGGISLGSVIQKSTIGTISAFDRLTSPGYFRNPAANVAADDSYMGQFETKSVKVGQRWGPDIIDTSTAAWKGQPVDQIATARGAQIASYNMGFRARLGISALLGSFGVTGLSSLTNDVAEDTPASDAVPITYARLLDTQSAFGDMAGDLVVYIMHSKVWHDLIKGNVGNAQRLFNYGTINVMFFLDKIFFVTDLPELKVVATGVKDHYNTIGLRAGACLIQSAGEFDSVTEKLSGMDNIVVRTQAQDAAVVSVHNMKYTATAAPTSFAALSTSGNWATGPSLTGGSVKDFFGVRLITN